MTDDRPSANSDLLLLAGKIIAIMMQGLMAFGGVILGLVALALLFSGSEMSAQVAAAFNADSDMPRLALAGVMAIGFAIVAALFLFFDRLRLIIDTVGEGDPFAPVNATRLAQMAWLSLGIQLLFLPAAGFGLLLSRWADAADHADVTFGAGLDLKGILITIVLFILARVFRHGAAMRDDLEGTV